MMTQELKTEIEKWLQAGSDYQAGLKIYVRVVGKGHPTIYVFRNYTEQNHKTLITSLAKRAGVPTYPVKPTNTPKKENNPTEAVKKPKLRSDFEFLDDPSTPAELKILVSNKITAYKAFKKGHEKLFDCNDHREELNNARDVVENFIENFKIHQELHYYKVNKKILGKHPIFEEIKRLKRFRNTSTVDLMIRKRNVEHNIWRVKRQIAKGDKPHLNFIRNQKLEMYQVELAELNKVIGE